MDLALLLNQPNTLPIAPKIIQELIKSFNDDDISIDNISKQISLDVALSIKVLRLANSSYYHVSRKIKTIGEAITVLGFITIRSLIIADSLIAGFKNVPNFDLKRFWSYSLNTAVIAKWIARQINQNSDLAFTIGIIHGVGELIMHIGMPDIMTEIDSKINMFDDNRLEVENTTIGYNHIDVSAKLVLEWRFPEYYYNALNNYTKLFEKNAFNPIAGVLFLATHYSRGIENNISRDAILSSIPIEILTELNISIGDFDDMPLVSDLTVGLDNLLG